MQAGRHNLSLNKTDGDQHPFIDYATYEMQTQFSIIVIRTPTQYNKKAPNKKKKRVVHTIHQVTDHRHRKTAQDKTTITTSKKLLILQ